MRIHDGCVHGANGFCTGALQCGRVTTRARISGQSGRCPDRGTGPR